MLPLNTDRKLVSLMHSKLLHVKWKKPCEDTNYKFLVRLHGEYNTSLALWKNHVNLLLQSFRPLSSDLHQC